ncbi:neuromedin-U receptor 2-like isoform X1 [Penaeus chinensis]|uniref:neuromedin-U receptor 2-like isoform X1 n=1 Tax=Penaeus chinensis TaxID=139456 RepID=UPI001FB76CD6|nr:neuromedin-U receptor 2-like isoform X1 [Penaeus chinensis]XP_047470025.1 neuromedin-U receptor 2-like isoform X1 [Penaeus chinensis]XP_047470026.1 neuromedin-U receptor 2-like isoform X1 [Penaeus chinensis]XP_047470027.1 neuromedin-U receptor 2-like isoform X1 [Penaeus chinensis]XP_047470028.1 neuromedin-U receptor 2-like isoform X1 [Penaeus chinensis]
MDAGAFLAPLIPPWSPSTAAPSTALAEHLQDLLGAANDSLKVVLKPSSALESLAPTMAAPTTSWAPSDDALVNFTLDAAAANLTLNGTPSDDDLDVQEFIFNNLGPQRLPYRTSLTVVYVLIAVAGLVGNVLTCLVVLRNLSMRTSTNYYLVNLAVADIITLLFALPMEVYHMWLQYPWILGDALCRVRAIVPETLAHVSVLTILAVSGERYVAITDPVLARTTHTLSRTARVVPIIWLVALLAATPWGYYHQVNQLTLPSGTVLKESSWCAVPFHDVSCNWAWLMWASSVGAFILPMGVLVTLYCKIGIVLSIDPPSRTPSAGNGAMHTRRLGIRMLVAVVVVFFLCWAPFHAQRLMFVIVTSYGEWTPHLRTVNANLYYFTGLCYYLNSAVNPVLYSIMSVRFRIAFRRSLCGGKEWARRQLYISNTYGPQIASNHSNFLNRTREVSTASTKFVTRADPKRQLEPPNRNGFTYAYEPMDLEG